MKTLFKITLLLFFSLSYSSSFAFPVCTDPKFKTVDLTSGFGPVRDQDSVGWCYAFTAADLTGFYLKQGNTNLISPVGVAQNYNAKRNANHYSKIKGMTSQQLAEYNRIEKEKAEAAGKTWEDLLVYADGGSIDAALNDIKERGYCLEDEAPSESFSFVLEKKCLEKNLCAKDLKELLELIYDKAPSPNEKAQKNLCDLTDVLQGAYPFLQEKQIKQLLSKTSRATIYADLTKITCVNRIPVKQQPKVHRYSDPDGEKLLLKLDSLLERGLPVGIDYYGEILNEENIYGDPDETNHASLIIGKRINPVTCEKQYILRNSYGPSCETYRVVTQDYWQCTKIDDKSFQQSIDALKVRLSKVQDANEKEEITAQLEYFASDLNLKAKKDFYCSRKFPAQPRNPGVTCDDKTGNLYVDKSVFVKDAQTRSLGELYTLENK